MRRKRPRVAALDEVRITREGKVAVIEHADESVAGVRLTIEQGLAGMSDLEVLDRHNEVVRSQERLRANYQHVAIEVPVGRPQIRYFELGRQWTPRGDVLRCGIGDDEQGELVVQIDDQELTMREFAGLLLTYAGWGMRITFVPEDDTEREPVIRVVEPAE